jgi:hypothetical protein
MAGQGSPPAIGAWSHYANRVVRRAATAALLLLLTNFAYAAEETQLRLRASWGGGSAVAWSGSVRLSTGQLSIDQVLGIEADAAGVLMQTESNVVQIVPRTPRRYDGVDLQVTAPPDAVLHFEFTSHAAEAGPVKFEVPLEQLLHDRFAQELDLSGNRFALHRSPGDNLRFASPRDHLVFYGGEEFAGEFIPHHVTAAANASLKCSFRLVAAGSDTPLWQHEVEATLDSEGSAPALPVQTTLPLDEGVYELVCELHTKRFASPLVRAKLVAERRVQLVVLSQQAPPREASEWSTVAEFDPTQPRLWDRMLRLPGMKMLAGFNKGPLGSEPTGKREHLGSQWSTLKGTGWQAYPLPVAQLGQPHLLEIEFPSDLSQVLGISVVEPNGAGWVVPLGLDSGIDVDPAPVGQTVQVLTHRLVFWPRTHSPVVLLTNRHATTPALFGKIRVLGGPATLPAPPAATSVSETPGRMVAAYFDRPLFPENFSVSESLDAKSGRSIDDWLMFHRGGTRLVEYLRYSGHNAAVVSVVSEGSALYPSEVLAPTPKYDSGAFSEAAIDPLRKDVVEALLRLFDREQLAFVPAVQFASILPELEQIKASAAPGEATGIDLLIADGRRWADAHPPRRGAGPHYNLLDPRVQQAMRRVVLEIAERYQHHSSLRAIAIQMSGDTYAWLPDDACGLDATTVTRFAHDCGLTVPTEVLHTSPTAWDWIQRTARSEWVQWRAREVTRFYRDLQADLQAVRPELQLLLCPTEPLQSRRLQQHIRPRLPPNDRTLEGLLQAGIDPAALRQIPGLILARPYGLEISQQAGLDPSRSEINHSEALSSELREFRTATALTVAEPLPLRLEAFDKVSPFGPATTRMYLFSHLTPVGSSARRRFAGSLADSDAQWILDGGQMLLLGQEDATRNLLTTLQALPAQTFADVHPSTDESDTRPLVLRRWSDANSTWLYLVNKSPWPMTAEVDFAARNGLQGDLLGPAGRSIQLKSSGNVARWTTPVEPFGMVALQLRTSQVKVAAWKATAEPAIEAAIREQIREIRLRANTLRSPPPLTQLANGSFEAPPEGNQPVPRWSQAEGAGIQIQLDGNAAKTGASSLYMVSRAPGRGDAAPVAWVRSEPLTTPTTGRLAIWVWLKVADAKRQPKLRLAIEGRLDGEPYYRRANVGASEDGRATQPLLEEWSPFLFPVDDLPTTGLTDLQIGFDMMGEGEIWIDDVQTFDLWFQDVERDSLLKRIALADFHAQEGKLGDAYEFLGSHWPQFLRRHVTLTETRVATLPPTGISPPAAPAPAPAPAKSPGMFDGLRRWVPRVPFQK